LSPEKVLKIEGKVLLDLRAKITELESELTKLQEELQKTKEELEKTKEVLKETHHKLIGREKSLIKISEKFSASKRNLDSISEKKLITDIELTRLKPKLEELEIKVKEANDAFSNLKSELNFTIEKANEMEQTLKFKEKAIENHKKDLEKRKKDIDILNEVVKLNQKETDELIGKIKSLEAKLSEVRSTPKVLERIKEMMVHKGFLSDRELDDIFKEFD
jgi:exonuclease SbcC